MASGPARSLLGLPLWSGSQRATSLRRTWTAPSGFSKSPHLWNQRYSSVQNLQCSRRLHCNAQPLMGTKATPPYSRTLSRITRRFHSEIPGKKPEDSTQSHKVNVNAGDGFNALVSSSPPMPDKIQILLERKTASTSGKSQEPASKEDTTNPNTSSQHPAEPFTDQSTSKEDIDSDIGGLVAAVLVVVVIFWVWDPFATKDGFRKKEEERKTTPLSLNTSSPHPTEPFSNQSSSKKDGNSETAGVLAYLLILLLMVTSWALVAKGEESRKEEVEKLELRTQRTKLAEELEALDKEHMEHCRECELVLEVKMETEEALIETDRALESAREAVNARILHDGIRTDKLHSEKGDRSPIVWAMILGLGVSIGMCVFGD